MFDQIVNRYLIKAEVVFTAPFHIGAGVGDFDTDNPVIRDAAEKPFIPGSSIKGVLRSTVERLAPAVFKSNGIKTCQLSQTGSSNCLTVRKTGSDEYEKQVDACKKRSPDSWELELARWVEGKLCSTCRLFGSPYQRSKIIVEDAPLVEDEEVSQLGKLGKEIRDGVGIDRSTGTAAKGLKYDYEVVPLNQNRYRLTIRGENLDSTDLKLLALGLAEMADGRLRLGGITTRGLGNFKLDKAQVFVFRPDGDPTKLLDHILKDKYSESQPLDKFLDVVLLDKSAEG